MKFINSLFICLIITSSLLSNAKNTPSYSIFDIDNELNQGFCSEHDYSGKKIIHYYLFPFDNRSIILKFDTLDECASDIRLSYDGYNVYTTTIYYSRTYKKYGYIPLIVPIEGRQ